MRNDRGKGISGHPVRFLYDSIEQSKAFPDDVKAHILQMIRPYTRIYNVTFEQAAASAIALNAFAQYTKWQAVLTRQQTDTDAGVKKSRTASREARSWASACAKFMRLHGLERKKGYRANRQEEIARRKKEIPPPRPTAGVESEASPPIAETA